MTDNIAATPGPWRYSVSDYDGEFVITGSNEGGGSVLPILGRTHNFPRNAEANARLIAAAPDLLAALEVANRVFQFDLRKMLVMGADYNQAVKDAADAVAAALAKAQAR